MARGQVCPHDSMCNKRTLCNRFYYVMYYLNVMISDYFVDGVLIYYEGMTQCLWISE